MNNKRIRFIQFLRMGYSLSRMNWQRVFGRAMVLFIIGITSVFAQDDPIGFAEYRLHCAVCHGVTGEGEGSISGLLNAKPEDLDLTRIASDNNGKYPYRMIFQIIDGRQNVAAHGERMMPIWGDRYSIEASAEYGPYGAKKVIHGRILELLYFIQGIQKE